MTNTTYFSDANREDDSSSTTSPDVQVSSQQQPAYSSSVGQVTGELKSLILKSFSFRKLKAATRSFRLDSLLGEGSGSCSKCFSTFHYALDLKKQHDREEIRRRIRAHAAVMRAVILYKSDLSAGDRDKGLPSMLYEYRN